MLVCGGMTGTPTPLRLILSDSLRGSPGTHLLVGFSDFHLQVVALLVVLLNLAVDLPAQLLKRQRQLVTCGVTSWGRVQAGSGSRTWSSCRVLGMETGGHVSAM